MSFARSIAWKGMFLIVLLSAVAGSVPAFASVPGACGDAVAVPLDGTLRGAGDPRASSRLFTVEAPGAGLLALEVTAPASAPGAPKLGLWGRDCRPPGDASLVVETSPTRLVVAVESAGTYSFRVAAQDPALRLGRFKVASFFFGAEDDGDGWGSIVAADGEDPREIEIDPDRAPAPPDCCALGDDDHADTFTCATPLAPGGRAGGELGNGWGDDADVFAFRLEEQRTVVLTASGAADTVGVLYDRAGQQLAADDGGGGGHFRIARTLGPGLYYVRVEGRDGAAGPYRLHLRAVPW